MRLAAIHFAALWHFHSGSRKSRANFSVQHMPVPAFPDRRDICQWVNRELVKKFATLGKDPNSVDPARVMRVLGRSRPRSVVMCGASISGA